MGLQTKPAYIGTAGFQNPVENDRNLIEHHFGRSGVLRYGNFDLAAVAGVMQAQVQPGSAVVLGSASTQGAYWGYSDAVENLVWPAANGSNPRWDTLIMRIIDTQYGASGAGDLLRWEILSGTAAASPTVLTDTNINTSFPQPGAWMRMWDVRVPAAVTNLTTATFTRRFGYTNTTGIILYNSAVESRPSGLFRGETCMDVSNGWRYWWNGSVWVPQAGTRLFSFLRGPGLIANNKIATAITGEQTMYTTASIPCEPNMEYEFTSSMMLSSGVGGTHFFKSNIYVGGVQKFQSGEFAYTGGNQPQRSSIVKGKYVTGGAETSMTLALKSNNGAASAYDVWADPTGQIWLTVEATGRTSAEVST